MVQRFFVIGLAFELGQMILNVFMMAVWWFSGSWLYRQLPESLNRPVKITIAVIVSMFFVSVISILIGHDPNA